MEGQGGYERRMNFQGRLSSFQKIGVIGDGREGSIVFISWKCTFKNQIDKSPIIVL
jgi:hypothetical protein